MSEGKTNRRGYLRVAAGTIAGAAAGGIVGYFAKPEVVAPGVTTTVGPTPTLRVRLGVAHV